MKRVYYTHCTVYTLCDVNIEQPNVHILGFSGVHSKHVFFEVHSRKKTFPILLLVAFVFWKDAQYFVNRVYRRTYESAGCTCDHAYVCMVYGIWSSCIAMLLS